MDFKTVLSSLINREADLSEIKALAAVPGSILDWKTIEQYADLLGANMLIDEIRRGN